MLSMSRSTFLAINRIWLIILVLDKMSSLILEIFDEFIFFNCFSNSLFLAIKFSTVDLISLLFKRVDNSSTIFV